MLRWVIFPCKITHQKRKPKVNFQGTGKWMDEQPQFNCKLHAKILKIEQMSNHNSVGCFTCPIISSLT